MTQLEIGGTPELLPREYAERSPLTYAHRIAASCVPLELWWSRADRIVLDQRWQSGQLFLQIKRLNPRAPVEEFVGSWTHSVEMQASTRLPVALALFGLLPPPKRWAIPGTHFVPPPATSARCGA
jgi:peptidoglycan/LPS O-acetylase OafA/YrhL